MYVKTIQFQTLIQPLIFETEASTNLGLFLFGGFRTLSLSNFRDLGHHNANLFMLLPYIKSKQSKPCIIRFIWEDSTKKKKKDLYGRRGLCGLDGLRTPLVSNPLN